MPPPTADTARTTYGFDGLRKGAFPPIYINRWIRWQTVPTEQLIGELRFWADHLESLLDSQGEERTDG